MALCSVAFIDLTDRFDDILKSSFLESPVGDKTRVRKVGENLIKLLANSYYTLTWLNAKQANESFPGQIDFNNITEV